MKNEIKIKQLEFVYSHLPISLSTGYVAFFFAVFFLWDNVNHYYFKNWIIVFNIFMIYRVANYFYFNNVKINSYNYELLYNSNLFGTFLTGIIWGALPFFYNLAWPVEIQVSLWMLLIALMSGASVSFSAIIKYYVAYVLPIFMLSMYMLLATENYYISFLFFAYTFLLLITSFNFHRLQNTIFSNQYALELSNTELQSLATRDALTNLPNRRAFDEYLRKEWARHVRSNLEMSLIMLDVDFFKRYNDHYGHGAGDKCLKIIADVLQQSLHRPSDKVARYGGEEFIILLPETPTKGALEVAERVHEKLRAQDIPHDFSDASKQLTISIGITTIKPKKDEDPKILQLMADKELYKAKANGRNQTSVYKEDL